MPLSSLCCYVEWCGSAAFQIYLGKDICKETWQGLSGGKGRVHIKSGYFKLDHSWYNRIPWRNSWGHLDERILEVVSRGDPGVWFLPHWEDRRAQSSLYMSLNFSRRLLPLIFLPLLFLPLPIRFVLLWVFLPGSSLASLKRMLLCFLSVCIMLLCPFHVSWWSPHLLSHGDVFLSSGTEFGMWQAEAVCARGNLVL